MVDQLEAMLTYATAAAGPMRFRVRSSDGSVREQEVAHPFAVIGRGENCDLSISHPTVAYRHVYIQPVGTRLACIDLFSTTGIEWGGPPFRGWLSPEHTMRIGPAQIELIGDNWTYDETLKPPLEFRPRDEQRPEYGVLPRVDLELLNTRQKGKKWPINRVITLVGRDERCRITVVDDRLSRVHCSLLLLPSGLWVIDLFGKGGTQVNGQACRCAMLAEGAELALGPFRLTARYAQSVSGAAAAPRVTKAVEKPADADARKSNEFLTRPNRIFQAETDHDTLIVVPLGDSRSFFYQDLHIEASRIMEMISQRGFRHVVVDFSQVEQVGQLILETLTPICRAASGKAALCGANDATYATLQTSPLPRLFEHFATREDAIRAVHL